MSCADCELLIALDIEGDLPPQKAGALAQHLRTCPSCREFAESLRSSQTLLKELRLEKPDEATLQAVRQGILNRLPVPDAPQAVYRWRFVFGAALAAILVVVAIILSRPSQKPRRDVAGMIGAPHLSESVRAAPEAPALPPHLVRQSKAGGAKKSRMSLYGRSEKRQHPEPIRVKLITDNPNITIYWLVD